MAYTTHVHVRNISFLEFQLSSAILFLIHTENTSRNLSMIISCERKKNQMFFFRRKSCVVLFCPLSGQKTGFFTNIDKKVDKWYRLCEISRITLMNKRQNECLLLIHLVWYGMVAVCVSHIFTLWITGISLNPWHKITFWRETFSRYF